MSKFYSHQDYDQYQQQNKLAYELPIKILNLEDLK
jgi:hypothetical protein